MPIRRGKFEAPEYLVRHIREATEHLRQVRPIRQQPADIGVPQSPADLTRLESLSFNLGAAEHLWQLTGPDGTSQAIAHKPRLTTDDMTTLRQAALGGAGIVQLPDYFLAQDIADGKLEVLLPAWSPPRAVIHAVFPSRRGLLPAVRTFIDFLADEIAGA